MIALRASCSTWILPLMLLHLLVTFHLSFSFPVGLHEFSMNVNKFGDIVKNCSESCTPGHSTNGSCQCFNFSVSPQECGFPEYFIKGLNSMHPNTSIPQIQDMIDIMKFLGKQIPDNLNFCSTGENNKVLLMSPKSFHNKLNSAKEQLNSRSA